MTVPASNNAININRLFLEDLEVGLVDKCVLFKHQDSSLVPQHPHKKPVLLLCAFNSISRRQRQKNPHRIVCTLSS